MKAVILIAIGSLACADARDRENVSLIADSSGVQIVETAARHVPEWSIATTSDLRIGAVDGEYPYRFDRIQAAYRFADGRILVANGGTNQLRYFDPDGRHIQSVGRRGAGPGEFVVLTSVVKLPTDTVLVYDIRSRRITRIAPAGRIAHVGSYPEVPTIAAGSLLGVLTRGDLAFRLIPPLGMTRQGYSRDTVLIAIASAGGADLDTLLKVPSGERFTKVERGPRGRRSLSSVHPFGYRAAVAVWNGMILTGDRESYEFRVFDSAARLRTIIRRIDVRRVPLNGRHVDAYLAAVARAGYSAEAERAEMNRYPNPRFVPAHDDILVDEVGSLWVADFLAPEPGRSMPARNWVVFDRSGRAVAHALTPPELEPMHITDEFVVGRVRDTLDVEFIQVHRLRRAAN
jgi:hypothetical protein